MSVRRRASADSSFSASSTASWTNRLTASSPHGPSTPRPNPPAKPLDAGEADAVDLDGLAIEQWTPRVGENSSTSADAPAS